MHVQAVNTGDVDAITVALERLLASQQFSKSPRASRFLRYIVETALGGRGHELKEYLLGLEVFDRPASFDPRNDTIVRVEAVKLRQRVQAYYRGPGRQDPLIIELPKGRYLPRFRLRRAEGPRRESRVTSIAVLPFANLSADPGDQYFSDGLTEEILTALGRVPRLRVAARTFAFALRGKEQDLRRIGQALKVGLLLEGSVRRSTSRIRIGVRLINASDGYHLWSESYDREMTDIFATQEEVAEAVARALKVKLTMHTEDLGSLDESEGEQVSLRKRCEAR